MIFRRYLIGIGNNNEVQMSKKSPSSKYIWWTLISVTVFFAVLIWFNAGLKMLDPEPEQPKKIILGEKANINYKMTVYYFPEKKSEADALGYFFKQQGYSVDVQKASTVAALAGSENSPSHIFYNRSEIDKAMKIKRMIEKLLGHAVNAYRFHEEQHDPSMMLVFTE